MNEREYEDLTIFTVRSDGKKAPFKLGYYYVDDKGEKRFQVTAFPPPGVQTDWSGVIQKRDRQQPGQQPQRQAGQQQRSAPRGYMNEREYEDLTIFTVRSDGKKAPFKLGYYYVDDKGEKRFQVTAFPPPGVQTDWSGVIQKRDRQQPGQQPQRQAGQQQRSAPRGYQREPGDDDMPF